MNFGATHASGKYIARIDADDLWHSEKLQHQFDYLALNSECVLLGTAYDEINALGELVKNTRVPLLRSSQDLKNSIPSFNPFSTFFPVKNAINNKGNEKFNFHPPVCSNNSDPLIARKYPIGTP